VGIIVFLNTKPATNFWIGTTVALFGMAMLVGFKFFLDFDTAFLLAVLAGVLYSIYLLMSKNAFSDGRTLFHDNQHPFIIGIFRCCLCPT
jgi:drug/metabolite transporter (DMT)-like permease